MPARREVVTSEAERAPRSWVRGLLLFALAVGIVVMHHVAGAQQHSPDHTPAAGQVAVASAANRADSGASPASSNTATAPVGTVELQAHPADGGKMSMLGHLCLAVLAGLAAITALLLSALSGRPEGSRPRFSVPIAWTSSRAPPTPRRLAQLQVLRL